MAEVLNDVEAVSAPNHAQPDHVEGRVEQVGTMGRRKHEVFVAVLGVVVERDLFSLLLKFQSGGQSETLGEGGFTVKLRRKLPGIHHGGGMVTGCFRKARIQL